MYFDMLRKPRKVAGAIEQPGAVPQEAALVLVLDDNRAVAESTAMLLGSVGMRVLVAIDAAQALQALAARDASPDLIVCDYHLGDDRSGIHAIRRIREVCATKRLPAIVFSGDTSAAVTRAVSALDDCRLLEKPASGDELLCLCADLLQPQAATARHGLRPP